MSTGRLTFENNDGSITYGPFNENEVTVDDVARRFSLIASSVYFKYKSNGSDVTWAAIQNPNNERTIVVAGNPIASALAAANQDKVNQAGTGALLTLRELLHESELADLESKHQKTDDVVDLVSLATNGVGITISMGGIWWEEPWFQFTGLFITFFGFAIIFSRKIYWTRKNHERRRETRSTHQGRLRNAKSVLKSSFPLM